MNDINERVTTAGETGTIAPHAALVTVQLLFGSLPVIAKVVLAAIPSVALVGMRVGITAIVLLIFQTVRRRLWLQHKRDYIRLAVLSVFGVVLNQLLFIGGLSMTKASNVSLLAVTIPIFAILISSVAGYDSLSRPKAVGVLLAAIGVVLLIDPRNASFSSESTIGDIFIVLNSLSFGIYVATSKEVVTRNGPFRSMMWVFIFSSLVCVPLGLVSLAGVELNKVETEIWGLVVYISVAATAGPYLLNAFAISKVQPSVVAVFIYLQPLIGFVLAVLFLGESIGASFVAAAALVFAGLFFATRQRGVSMFKQVDSPRNAEKRPET